MSQNPTEQSSEQSKPPRIDYIGYGMEHAEAAEQIINGSASVRRGEVAVVRAVLAVYYQLCELTDTADKNGNDIGTPLAEVVDHVQALADIASGMESAADERTGG